MFQIVSPYEGSPVHAGELTALIGVDQHPAFGLSSPDGHMERLQYHIRGLAALHRLAHHMTRIEVEYDCKVGKPFHGADVGDVCDPHPVGCLDIKLPGQRVVDDQRWPATMATWPPPVANLRFDASQFCQARHAVRTADLALIEQIIVQLNSRNVPQTAPTTTPVRMDRRESAVRPLGG